MKVIDQAFGNDWALYNADCVPFTRGLPANSIDLAVYSPPFSSLYIYGDSEADMGNCADDDEFFEQYGHFVRAMHRALRPGRLCAVHVKDLVYYQNSSPRGTAGLRAFSDRCTAVHIEAGFDFHSRITIARSPVREMQKTKAHGLLYKTLRKDTTFSRMGLPEYLMLYRKWASEGDSVVPVTQTKEGFTLDQWQRWASPVWNEDFKELPETDVLNVKVAREDRDEKHLCPMPLNITRRAVLMWSNPGETVYSPFAGIGSEGWVALQEGRKFVGCELKDAYFAQATRNLAEAERAASAGDLFAGLTA